MSRIYLCIVKTCPPMKSRTYATLEFKAEDRQTSPLCSKFSSSSSLSAPVRSVPCVAAVLTSCLENLALRQQVTALKKERRRPPLGDIDRAFWAALRQSWPLWASRLVIVKADTVARWHRDRFRRYWAKISQRRRPGRPRVDTEIRQLIRTMAQDGWGAPRIHAELMKLGFGVSEITVSRYLPRRPAEPDEVKRWVAFLRNHKHDIAAMDLFTVPTASLRLLYGFFVIKHGRRHIVHFNATFNPTASWVMQQLREAFPYDTAPRYLIFDRDAIFSPAVVECVRSFGIEPIRISYRNLRSSLAG